MTLDFSGPFRTFSSQFCFSQLFDTQSFTLSSFFRSFSFCWQASLFLFHYPQNLKPFLNLLFIRYLLLLGPLFNLTNLQMAFLGLNHSLTLALGLFPCKIEFRPFYS